MEASLCFGQLKRCARTKLPDEELYRMYKRQAGTVFLWLMFTLVFLCSTLKLISRHVCQAIIFCVGDGCEDQ